MAELLHKKSDMRVKYSPYFQTVFDQWRLYIKKLYAAIRVVYKIFSI